LKNNTLNFYNNNSKTYIETTLTIDMSNLYKEFLNNIPKGGTILDLGCGSGRDSKAFIVRTVSIVAALIAGCMSFPAIGMLAYIAIAKYPQLMQMTPVFNDMFTLNEVYTSPMTEWLIARPYLFYMYFISCAIFAVLFATTIYTFIKNMTDKKRMQ